VSDAGIGASEGRRLANRMQNPYHRELVRWLCGRLNRRGTPYSIREARIVAEEHELTSEQRDLLIGLCDRVEARINGLVQEFVSEHGDKLQGEPVEMVVREFVVHVLEPELGWKQ